MPKFIVITGGVVSGLGKGTATASIARILNGNKINIIKCDGYLNVDPGTMSPTEHGEVFVLEDGTEGDMDFGHYERFTNLIANKDWSITSGKIFNRLLEKEREGKFLGKTVQVIPHLVDEIIENWNEVRKKENSDISLIEIGGTIGDIENSWFVEAVRRLRKKSNLVHVHLSFAPFLNCTKEIKTKPVQRDIDLLKSYGLEPDILLIRGKTKLTKNQKNKISDASGIPLEQVISAPDIDDIYEIPLNFVKEGIGEILEKKLGVKTDKEMKNWKNLVENLKTPKQKVKIGVFGKYTSLEDSYASIREALRHASAHLEAEVAIDYLDTENLEKEKVENYNGIIIPGGFGTRGIEGKIETIKIAREKNIPLLGICYGMQLIVIEYARNILGLKDANTAEINPEGKNNVIALMDSQKKVVKKGGTMRLGSYPAFLEKDSLAEKIYKKNKISERHRHRFEVNPEYIDRLENAGLKLSGRGENKNLVEFAEIKEKLFFIGTQGHPELKSRLENPAPLFIELVKAGLKKK